MDERCRGGFKSNERQKLEGNYEEESSEVQNQRQLVKPRKKKI